jgi:hypothetical protein
LMYRKNKNPFRQENSESLTVSDYRQGRARVSRETCTYQETQAEEGRPG